MEKINDTKSCLLVSYGPVPSTQYQKIEGGGMRIWGLAKGLQKNGIEVTIAINDAFPQDATTIEDIKIVNWSPNQEFIALINSFDAVLVSYSMGSEAVFIAENIDNDITLILDAYVPIYVEVSARQAEDMSTELRNYQQDMQRWNHVLTRGDFFLCANESQKILYMGILSALGVVNPRSYLQKRILEVPFGIHDTKIEFTRDPYLELGIKPEHKTVLWFGGLYPWFRAEDYLLAIKHLVKQDDSYRFVFVGGKNPFNANPDFVKQYDVAVSFAKENGLYNKSIFFVDWVDFDDRINWYAHADVVISLNQPGEENAFSWRTRVMDYVWGEVVTITNGGDPLGDRLLEAGAAIKLTELSPDSIKKTIAASFKSPELLRDVKKNVVALKPSYFWKNITKVLASHIKKLETPYQEELDFRLQHNIELLRDSAHKPERTQERVMRFKKARKVSQLPMKVYLHARQKGLKRTAKLAGSMIKNRAIRTTTPRTSKQFLFLTNSIDNSGAPMVLLDILREAVKLQSRKQIRILTPLITDNQRNVLRKLGLGEEKSAVLSPRLTGLQLSIKKDDFVFINTIAVYDNYRNYIFNLLTADKLNKAYWFIHEDIKQLDVISPQLAHDDNKKRIKRLVDAKKLTILVPSERVKKDYEKLFDIKDVRAVPLHVNSGKISPTKRNSDDFDTLRFFMSGVSSDGRKGQLIAIAAFQKFLDKYHAHSPKQYRDFEVHFVSILDDYVSTQVKTIGYAALGDRLKIYPPLPRDEALKVTNECNVVMCTSLNETFGLFVAEGMLLGHIVLRNDAAGREEQLIEGKNGYYIDSNDTEQIAKVLEKILNRKTSSNQSLAAMGLSSQKISESFSKNSYASYLDL